MPFNDDGSLPLLPELLLPAGGFDAGIAAFEGGADAIYLGFRDFSARKQAKNFDKLEYRRILRYAREGGKRVYVTLNTIVKKCEYGDLSRHLAFLGRFPPDAILIQDWGLASLIRDHFSGIPIHASTQTAIQTPEAARLAADAGVSRVVLPRECGIADLKRFKAEVPNLEYEVFVHGALCYSYSGLCLASGLLLGRSGNRGACAQVCRSYYEILPVGSAAMDGHKRERAYWFSCRDLELVDELAVLVATGVDSLKVEGRMKAPEYVYSVARLYRSALDALVGRQPWRIDLEALKRDAHVAFFRSSTRGYSHEPSGTDILNSGYPGHRGIVAGKVLKCGNGKALIALSEPLGLRDGLLVFPAAGLDPRDSEPRAFSVIEMRDGRSGKELVTARAGSTVEIGLPPGLLIPPTAELRKISSRIMDRRLTSPDEYPPAVSSLHAVLGIEAEAGLGNLSLAVSLPRFDALTGHGPILRQIDEEKITLSRSRKDGSFAHAAEIFCESGDEDFRLDIELDESRPIPAAEGAFSIRDLFVPPSILKKAKNRLYDSLAPTLERAEVDYAEASLAAFPEIAGETVSAPPSRDSIPRAAIVFPQEGLSSGMPFATPRILREGMALPSFAGRLWLPLSPLVTDWAAYAAMAHARVESELASGAMLMVGIDALHHAAFAQSLCSLDPEGTRLAFFGDVHLYIASSRAESAWRRFVPRLAFEYAYIEAGDDEAFSASILPVGSDFEPPLFISRACFAKYNLFNGQCPPSCAKKYRRELVDRDRHYVLVVEDCVTMLFKAPSP